MRTLPSTIHFSHNRPIHASAAFSLHLIAQMDAIVPLYGDAAKSLVLLDAGYLGQHLCRCAGDVGLGLTPIGGFEFDKVRERFQLAPSHRYVHSLMGEFQ